MRWHGISLFATTLPRPQTNDDKFIAEEDGVLYPRAGTLGGCTAHNAMIMVYPHDADWDDIAELTGDRSWRARRDAALFRAAGNLSAPLAVRLLYRLTGIESDAAWLDRLATTERALPLAALEDSGLANVLHYVGLRRDGSWLAAEAPPSVPRGRGRPERLAAGEEDAGGRASTRRCTTRGHARTGTRELLLDVAARHPDRLQIELNALADRVLFDGPSAPSVSHISQATALPRVLSGPEPRRRCAARTARARAR